MRRALASLFAFLAVACGTAGPAPAPAGSPLGVTQLKFAVLDSVGRPAYCDPDFYPLARAGGEQASAIAKYPAIRADSELYAAIVTHEHLPSGDLSDAEKLVLYRAWKLVNALTLTQTGSDYSFQYRVLSKTGAASYLMVSGTVHVNGAVTVSSRTPTGAPNCPICLAASTLISTPNGDVRVTEIKVGMLVWTANAGGARIAKPVLETGSTLVPAGHLMVHLILADGRELLASPGHRTADGRELGSLTRGAALDGSVVTTWELVPYSSDRTYDLLPAGPTGAYWANGVLLSSTLLSRPQTLR